MLYIAALSLLLVSFGHSYYGEKLLLRPIFKSNALSFFKHEQAYAEKVLRAGWHILTATWVVMAIMLVALQAKTINFEHAYLWANIIPFGIFGIGSLVASRGRHLSWIFFFTTAVCSLVYYLAL